jgi:hypothetical protein
VMDLTTVILRALGIMIAIPVLCLVGYLLSFSITGGVLSAKDAHRKRSQCGNVAITETETQEG